VQVAKCKQRGRPSRAGTSALARLQDHYDQTIAIKTIPDIGTDRALRRFPGKPSLNGLVSMISGTYLRRQADTLIAMSRATFDLTIAGRLRRMAAELQDKAAQDKAAYKAAEEDDALLISPNSSRVAGGRRGCSR
jgi:hypothetical protein